MEAAVGLKAVAAGQHVKGRTSPQPEGPGLLQTGPVCTAAESTARAGLLQLASHRAP